VPEQEKTGQEGAPAPKKKGVFGCSFPLFIGLLVIVLALLIVGLASGPIGKSLGAKMPGFLSLPQPEPEFPAEVVFHIFGFPITNSIVGTWLTMIVLVGIAFAATRRMKIVPGKLQTLLEFVLGTFLLSFCQTVAGKKNGRRFFPIVATIFLFVLFNGWLSLLPGFGSILIEAEEHEVHLLRGANTDINTPLAIAVMSFIFVEFFGLSVLGIGYLKKFFNVGQMLTSLGQLVRGKIGAGLSGFFMGFINFFIGIIELLSELVRIVSFTLRLFGNMTAGEILLLMAAFLVPFVFADLFYGFELLFGFIQALIFASLTLIFLTVAVTSHEHKEHGEAAHK